MSPNSTESKGTAQNCDPPRSHDCMTDESEFADFLKTRLWCKRTRPMNTAETDPSRPSEKWLIDDHSS